MDEVNLYNQFLAVHKPQLLSSGVPEHFWQALFVKINTELFDAGSSLSLMLIDYTDVERDETNPVFTVCVSDPDGIKASDPNAIFLIDHAWTFRISHARQQLQTNYALAERMSAITGVDLEDPDRVEKIVKAMWKYCQAYSIFTETVTPEERVPIWYIMDELGSAVNHSDDPNFRIVPFMHVPTQATYSLLFPIKDCDEGDQVTRDYVENVDSIANDRDALLLPWKRCNFLNRSFAQVEPDEEYFTTGHVPETLPDESANEPELNHDEPFKVYTEYPLVKEYLTEAYYELVETEEEADILWLTRHYRNFNELSLNTPNKLVNQFPHEFVITVKDLLSIVCRRTAKAHHNEDTLETYPEWLPTTYNLKTELAEFVSYFQHREAKGLDNHWIIKPWNLARTLDTHITSNINQIVRLPTTGPKIAQKYIENPVLFFRPELDCKVKFDVRYVILLRSVSPLVAYVDRKFFLRFSNKKFSLDNFDDYEKHFTVMNYNEEVELRHIQCEEFVELWRQQYPYHPWNTVEDKICEMLKEMLVCATKSPAPKGIAHCLQSRALYAADIMLAWKAGGARIQPKLLEVNYMPDCKRACEYYPDFFNEAFDLLFLDETDDEEYRLL